MLEDADPRKVVIDHCYKWHRLSPKKRSAEKFSESLTRIYLDITERASTSSLDQAWFNGPTLTSDQAWLIAEETWSFAMRFIGPGDAAAILSLHIPRLDDFEDMTDDDRVLYLSDLALAMSWIEVGTLYHSAMLLQVLFTGICVATDALLASSPELFYTEVTR